jgi:ribosome-associated heat shock protein Hsp15
MRIDKWLWAARFFKTRALASHACELGRIECNGQPVKPSRELRAQDRLRVKNDSGTYEIVVLQLTEMRGPATVAQTLYAETEESKHARQEAAEQRKLIPRIEMLHEGKISKRDRRRFNWIRGKG